MPFHFKLRNTDTADEFWVEDAIENDPYFDYWDLYISPINGAVVKVQEDPFERGMLEEKSTPFLLVCAEKEPTP